MALDLFDATGGVKSVATALCLLCALARGGQVCGLACVNNMCAGGRANMFRLARSMQISYNQGNIKRSVELF